MNVAMVFALQWCRCQPSQLRWAIFKISTLDKLHYQMMVNNQMENNFMSNFLKALGMNRASLKMMHRDRGRTWSLRTCKDWWMVQWRWNYKRWKNMQQIFHGLYHHYHNHHDEYEANNHQLCAV